MESVVLLDNEETAIEFFLPKFSSIFYIAYLTGILLSVDPSNVPTTTCGDGYAINTKGNRLLDEVYGIKAPFSKCLSHLASGTIPHLCTFVHHSQQDVVSLNKNFKSLLKHFGHSGKSMEIVNEAYNSLSRNSVHILNWGCTRMPGFLDACVQSSRIIVPFLDTLVNHKIWQHETKFIASPKGVYLLQLFSDLHPVFPNRYLHQIDSDNVLICEVHCVAYGTASLLLHESLFTPLADALYNSLAEDQHGNITAEFDIKGSPALRNH